MNTHIPELLSPDDGVTTAAAAAAPIARPATGSMQPVAKLVAVQLDLDAESAAEAQRYREGVESLMKLKSRSVISNGKEIHAAILFETFFKHARRKIRIFCKNLNPAVFDDENVIKRAVEAAERKVEIEIITQESPKADKFLGALHSGKPYIIRIRQAVGEAAEQSTNFAVMDSQAVRVEPNRGNTVAKAVMYDPGYATQLAQVFDRVFEEESTALEYCLA